MSDKPIGIDKNQFKFDFFAGSLVTGFRRATQYTSIALDEPLGLEVIKKPRSEPEKKRSKSNFRRITFQTADVKERFVNFHKEILTFDLQLMTT